MFRLPVCFCSFNFTFKASSSSCNIAACLMACKCQKKTFAQIIAYHKYNDIVTLCWYRADENDWNGKSHFKTQLHSALGAYEATFTIECKTSCSICTMAVSKNFHSDAKNIILKQGLTRVLIAAVVMMRHEDREKGSPNNKKFQIFISGRSWEWGTLWGLSLDQMS